MEKSHKAQRASNIPILAWQNANIQYRLYQQNFGSELSSLKAKPAKGNTQRRLFLSYRGVILSVTNNDLRIKPCYSPTFWCSTVCIEMQSNSGTAKDIPIKAVRYLICWISTGSETMLWESFWEQQKTCPLRLHDTCRICHQWTLDNGQSNSKRTSLRRKILRIHSTVRSKEERDGTGKRQVIYGPGRTANTSVQFDWSQANKKLHTSSSHA